METLKNLSFYNDPAIKLVDPASWDRAKIIVSQIKTAVGEVVKAYSTEEINVNIEQPKDSTHGDFATNVALQLSGKLGKNPREIALELVEKLKNSTALKNLVENIEIAGPGFINFSLNKEVLLNELLISLERDPKKISNILEGKKILLEYAHPNPFKAFHIGHLRNIILGESILRILQAQGAQVIPVNYQGDVGMHIAKCLWSFQKIDKTAYPEEATARVQLIAKCYTEGAKAFEDPEIQLEIKEINRKIYSKEDEKINELWKLGKEWSLAKFKILYNRVYSHFEREYFESDTLELCKSLNDEALAKGILEKSDGAIVFKGEKYGLETGVFINSQGLPTYEGKELGLAELEFSDWGNIDLCIHNVAVEQIGFFKVTFKVEALLNPTKFEGKQYHNAYEFVGLKTGKMSSRTGMVVLGEDILNTGVEKIKNILQTRENFSEQQINETAETIGMAAIKYAFLNISSHSYLAFDLEKSISFEGDSGPYLQYAFARANKMLEAAKGYHRLSQAEMNLLDLNPEEIAVIKELRKFSDVMIEAGKHIEPSGICTYLFSLTQVFNQFYKKHQILKEADETKRSLRLMITEATAKTISEGLYYLGIKTVNEM